MQGHRRLRIVLSKLFCANNLSLLAAGIHRVAPAIPIPALRLHWPLCNRSAQYMQCKPASEVWAGMAAFMEP